MVLLILYSFTDVTDVVRIGKWNLTPKGVIWNLNQFIQLQNDPYKNIESRIFNPTGTR